jgi:hypothetical protein
MNKRAVITIIALAATPACAGDCRYGSFAGQSVVSCDDGYVESRSARGVRSYGIRNGGFDRYPGQAPQPWALDGREVR